MGYSKLNVEDFMDFGAPKDENSYYFCLDIPKGRQPVTLYELRYEQLCYDGGFEASIKRTQWAKIRNQVQDDFNTRLDRKRLNKSKWRTGVNRLDKILGKELMYLFWLINANSADKLQNVLDYWLEALPTDRFNGYQKWNYILHGAGIIK